MESLLTNVSILVKYDLEDYEGASYKDAFDDLLHPPAVEWPNEAYRKFMEIVNKYQLSNSAGDSIINFFNKYSSLDISPLPLSTRMGKEFLDNSTIPHMMFKGIPITTFQNVEFMFYYRSLIKTIKSLLMIDSINRSLVLQYVDKKEVINGIEHRVFEEQYNCNWWRREESALLPSYRLLSIILYSDATTLDHMGKSSSHPIFLSLGNIPNHQRNKPESKALIGYLPILKAKDTKTKNSESFRKVQREVFQKCMAILLRPIVDKPELNFVVRDEIVTFIPRISTILADLAEADKIANVYQPSTSKRPCHSCLVSKDDLNNIKLNNTSPRTPNNMIKAINNGEAQDNSIHPEVNAFWEIGYVINSYY